MVDQWETSSQMAEAGMCIPQVLDHSFPALAQKLSSFNTHSYWFKFSRHRSTLDTMHNQSKPITRPNTRLISHTRMDHINRRSPAEGGSGTHRTILDQSRCHERFRDIPNVSTAFSRTGLRWTPYPPIVPPPRLPPLGFGLDLVPSGFSPAACSSGVNHPSAGLQSGPPSGSTHTHDTDQFDISNGFDITTPSTYANHFNNTTQFDNYNQFHSNDSTNLNDTMNPNDTMLLTSEISQQSVMKDSSSDVQVLSGGQVVTSSQSNTNHLLVDESGNLEMNSKFEENELESLEDNLEYTEEYPVVLAAPPTPLIKDDIRTFEITMNVWQLKPAEPEPPIDPKVKRTARKQGKAAKKNQPKPPQWIEHKGGRSIRAPISISTTNWDDFRPCVFKACKPLLSNSEDILETAYQHSGLYVQAFVYRAKKVTLDSDQDLCEFLDCVRTTTKTNRIGFKIIHPNPRKNLDLDLNHILEVSCAPISDESERDSEVEDEERETDGSDAVSPTSKKYGLLLDHLAKHFRKGENVAALPNPADAGEILVLNYGRILEWAQDWTRKVPGVDQTTPPMSRPGWRYVPFANYEQEKDIIQGRIKRGVAAMNEDHHRVAPVINNFYGDQSSSTSIPSHTPCKRSQMSPPPLIPSLDEFFHWAEIPEEEEEFCQILRKERVDFGRLLDQDVYSIKFLRDFGIPAAIAEDIFKAVPRYIHYLKSLKI